MVRSIIAAALAAGLLLMSPLPGPANAQTTLAKTEKAKTETNKSETTKTARPLSPAQQAMRDRQKKCGAEWKEAKAAGKVDKAMTWPKYWSACNKRLKTGG